MALTCLWSCLQATHCQLVGKQPCMTLKTWMCMPFHSNVQYSQCYAICYLSFISVHCSHWLCLVYFVCMNAKTSKQQGLAWTLQSADPSILQSACMDLANWRSINPSKCLHGSCKVQIPQSCNTSSLQSAGPTSSICSHHHLPEAMHCQIVHWPCSNWRGHHLKVILQSLLGRYLLYWQDLERRCLIFLSTCLIK